MIGMQNNINPADITNSNFLLLKLPDADKSETGILQQHEHRIYEKIYCRSDNFRVSKYYQVNSIRITKKTLSK